MAEVNQNILIEISTKIAGIDERTKALQEADKNAQEQANHRHNNLKMQLEGVERRLDNYVPRREIEAMNASVRTYAETLATDSRQHCDANREVIIGRVEKVEDSLAEINDNSKWIKRAMMTAGISALVAVGGYLWHILFVVKVAPTGIGH